MVQAPGQHRDGTTSLKTGPSHVHRRCWIRLAVGGLFILVIPTATVLLTSAQPLKSSGDTVEFNSLRRTPDAVFCCVRLLGNEFELVDRYISPDVAEAIGKRADTLYRRYHDSKLTFEADCDLFDRLLICYRAIRLRDYATCLSNAQIADGLAPDSVAPWRFLGIAAQQLGRNYDAEKWFLKILCLDGSARPFLRAQTYANMGALYTNQGRLGTARLYLEQAIRENQARFWGPELGATYNSMAIWYLKSNDFQQAREYFELGDGAFLPTRYRFEKFAVSTNSALLDVYQAESVSHVTAAIHRFERDTADSNLLDYEKAELLDNLAAAHIQLVRDNLYQGRQNRLRSLRQSFSASLLAQEMHRSLGNIGGEAWDVFRQGWVAARAEPAPPAVGDARLEAKRLLDSSLSLAEANGLLELAASCCAELAALETKVEDRVRYLFKELRFRAKIQDNGSYAIVDTIGNILARSTARQAKTLEETLQKALRESRDDTSFTTNLAVGTRGALEATIKIVAAKHSEEEHTGQSVVRE